MSFTSMSSPQQPDNPTNEQRHSLARYALDQIGRLEDFPFIRGLTSPPGDITSIARPGELKGCKIGIIGGGLAGMAAAFELKKLGCDITVFDANDQWLGGRVHTYYFDHEKKYYAEFGAARIPVTHETTWHYINLFRLNTSPFIQVNENALIYLRDSRARNDPQGRSVQKYIYPKYALNEWEKRTPWQELVCYGFERPLLNASPAVRSEILQVLKAYSPQILYWDDRDIRKILETSRLSREAISLISNFLPLAGQNLYHSYLDYVQELYTADLAFLYQIQGGFANLPLAFYKAILSKNPGGSYGRIPAACLGRVAWMGGTQVTGIFMDGNDGKPVLDYKCVKVHNSMREKFDYVICAIPFSTLRTVDIRPLFSSLKMQAIKEVNYIPAQKTALFCNRRFWEEGGPHEQTIGGISYTDLPITQIWYPSEHVRYCNKRTDMIKNSSPLNSLHFKRANTRQFVEVPGVLTVYSFNLDATRLANMNIHERFQEIKKEIEMVHGLPKGYLDSIVTDFKTLNWNTEPWFRGALCLYSPEQKRLFSYASAWPEYNYRVFFAGEHISAKHRWMQGALKSGMEAANALALAYKSFWR
ncbi:MAG: FAD-dependent oxidoreductase [Clostridia bacterium]|nr:FAD-dependent oxidoreductase [Clostridia bacterium]